MDLASLPNGVAGVKLETRAIVLRHGLPTPVPAMPASQAAADSMLAEGSPEVTKLISERSKLFLRIRQLRAAGLPMETALALLRIRTGSDYVFLARTCGIPEADGNIMDAAVAPEVQHVVGQTDLVGIPLNRVFLAGTLSGLGFQSVALTSPAAQAASWHACLPRALRRLNLQGTSALISVSPWAQ